VVDGCVEERYNLKKVSIPQERNLSVRILNSLLIALLLSCIPGCTTSDNDKRRGDIPIIKEHELGDTRFRCWGGIKDKWLRGIYFPALDRFKLRMSCGRCEYIYIRVILYIDSSGRLVKYKKVLENVCGKSCPKGLEEQLMQFFMYITFPEELRGIAIETMLGTGLKC